MLGTLEERTVTLLEAMSEIKAEVAAGTRQTEHLVNRMDIANGRTSKNESVIELHLREHSDDALVAQGRAAQRAEDKDRLQLVWDRIEKPVLYGLAGAGVGAGGILMGWFLTIARDGLWVF